MLELESLLIDEEDMKEKTEKKERKKRKTWTYTIEIDSGMDLAISKRKGEKESIFVLYRTQDLYYIKQDDTTFNLLNCSMPNTIDQIANFLKDLPKEEPLMSLFYGEIGRGRKNAEFLMTIIRCFSKNDLNFLVSLKSILGLENEVILKKLSKYQLENSLMEIDGLNEEGRRKMLNFFKNLVKNNLLSETDKRDLYISFADSSTKGNNPKIDYLNCSFVRWLVCNKTELAINLTRKMYENQHFLINCEHSYITPNKEDILRKIFNAKYNNYNALIDFFVFQPKIQGFSTFHQFLTEYLDYLNLQILYYQEIRDRYPDNILSDNQKLMAKYKEVKDIIDQRRFTDASAKQREYEDNIDEYIFISPKTPGDMVDEARQQNNCLKSYIQSFLEEKTNIFFLRKKEEPESSLVTIEVHEGVLNQACLAYNKEPKRQEKVVIQKWCDKHHITNNVFYLQGGK